MPDDIHPIAAPPAAPTLIVVGQTPPPYEGQAIMIAAMIAGLRERMPVIPIRMAYSASVAEAGSFAWHKVRHLCSLVRQTRAALRQYPDAVLYYPPAPARLMAVLRDIAFLRQVRGRARAVIFHFHAAGLADYLRRRPLLRWLGARAFRRPDVAIRPGASNPNDGEALGARHVLTIPCGRDVPLVPRRRVAGEPRLRILYVGIHRRSKGVFDAFATLAELRRRGVDAELRTAGAWFSAAEQAEAAAWLVRERLADRVTMRGALVGDELWQEYADADVFFFPTFYPWETQGVVVLEAMAYGLPVVSSDWQGPRDVVVEGVTGAVRPVGDVRAYAQALEQLALDPRLRADWGAAGRARYAERYTLRRFLDEMEAATRLAQPGSSHLDKPAATAQKV